MRRRAALVLVAGLALVSCAKKRSPFLGATGSGETPRRQPDGGDDLYIPPLTPPGEDAGLCGRAVVPLVVERPNFYFVLDASGSMKESMPDSQVTPLGIVPSRYTAARLAIRSLIRKVGHRISYGAAIFPAEATAGCTSGAEVFPTQPGDPVAYVRSKTDGPVESLLFDILKARTPDGLTPTAASLGAAKAPLMALTGKTYAFLLTDGAPNCNAQAACSAAQCTLNIEGLCSPSDGRNCCDPKYKTNDYRWCLDADPTVQAVAELASVGIPTYVIGMPGTGDYATVLNRLAEAGHTAQPSNPEYYPVQDAGDLADTLERIGLPVALSCDIVLEGVPPDENLVNVFFDQTVLTLDDADGWTWAAADTVRLVGQACADLKSGSGVQVEVAAGCPTVTR
jgi:hypothetical protein